MKTLSVTKQSQVLEALLNGEQLSSVEISQRFGVANPTSTITKIRFSGVPVYKNTYKDEYGKKINKYRVGKASKKLIAAGYRAISLGIV